MDTKLFIIKTSDEHTNCDNCPIGHYCAGDICDAFNITEYIDKIEEINIKEGLNTTILQMISADYKDRFIAEFNQTYIRFTKLRDMCRKWDANELNFTPTCSRDIYEAQLTYMLNYLSILWTRAKIEDVKLEVYPEDVDMFNSIDIFVK